MAGSWRSEAAPQTEQLVVEARRAGRYVSVEHGFDVEGAIEPQITVCENERLGAKPPRALIEACDIYQTLPKAAAIKRHGTTTAVSWARSAGYQFGATPDRAVARS